MVVMRFVIGGFFVFFVYVSDSSLFIECLMSRMGLFLVVV